MFWNEGITDFWRRLSLEDQITTNAAKSCLLERDIAIFYVDPLKLSAVRMEDDGKEGWRKLFRDTNTQRVVQVHKCWVGSSMPKGTILLFVASKLWMKVDQHCTLQGTNNDCVPFQEMSISWDATDHAFLNTNTLNVATCHKINLPYVFCDDSKVYWKCFILRHEQFEDFRKLARKFEFLFKTR